MTEELTIETLAVEIKVIRVGGHKMTKAVFEQIKKESVDDFDIKEGAIVLGHVHQGNSDWILFYNQFKYLRKCWVCGILDCDNEMRKALSQSKDRYCFYAKKYLPVCECINLGDPEDLKCPQLFIAT